MKNFRILSLIFLGAFVANSRAENYPLQIGSALWKSAEYGAVQYERCQLSSSLDVNTSHLTIHRLAVDCDGEFEGVWPFSQEIKNYFFEIDSRGNVIFGNSNVGSFKNKIFQATFRSEHEENIFVKIRFLDNQALSLLVSVDSEEFPSFEFWSE